MPFTPEEFRSKHNKKLTDKEAKTAADIANKLIATGKSEGVAIATANGVINNNRKLRKSKKANSVSKSPERE